VLRTPLFTALALTAFAGNSLLCRMALGAGDIDPAGFTVVRLVSGAVALVLIVAASRSRGERGPAGDWSSGAMLFLYAAAFSFAYVSLSTGTGALILFGAVQVTMIAAALALGERPHALEAVGLVIALLGLILLTAPGLEAPSPAGSVLMATAGVAWGIYTLRGRGAGDPILVTRGNFLRAVPLVTVVLVAGWSQLHLTPRGALLAVVSGALTSGAGYALWYSALSALTATRAAILQLTVPVLAALAGLVVLAEPVTMRLVVSAVLILGGVGLSLLRPMAEQ
jgi:drug/metabolite transporter (DMT)-like permease